MEKQAIEQSQKAYIAQFDPTSPDYHQGLAIPVALGGKRVPESMPQEHPENFDPAEVGPTSQQLGSEYQRIQKERALMTNLKKQLDRLSPFVQAIFRHLENFNTKADKNNEKHVELHKADVAKQQKEIQILEMQIAQTLQKLVESNKEFEEIQKQVQTVFKQSRSHFQTKEELTEFGFKVKRLTSKIFAATKKQMDALKKIKKNYKAPPKQEVVEEPKQEAPEQAKQPQ